MAPNININVTSNETVQSFKATDILKTQGNHQQIHGGTMNIVTLLLN